MTTITKNNTKTDAAVLVQEYFSFIFLNEESLATSIIYHSYFAKHPTQNSFADFSNKKK